MWVIIQRDKKLRLRDIIWKLSMNFRGRIFPQPKESQLNCFFPITVLSVFKHESSWLCQSLSLLHPAWCRRRAKVSASHICFFVNNKTYRLNKSICFDHSFFSPCISMLILEYNIPRVLLALVLWVRASCVIQYIPSLRHTPPSSSKMPVRSGMHTV